MEAGGFDETRANMKAVRVIRQEGSQVKNYYVNMKALLEGVQIGAVLPESSRRRLRAGENFLVLIE